MVSTLSASWGNEQGQVPRYTYPPSIRRESKAEWKQLLVNNLEGNSNDWGDQDCAGGVAANINHRVVEQVGRYDMFHCDE